MRIEPLNYTIPAKIIHGYLGWKNNITGSMIFIDEVTNETMGAGLIEL